MFFAAVWPAAAWPGRRVVCMWYMMHAIRDATTQLLPFPLFRFAERSLYLDFLMVSGVVAIDQLEEKYVSLALRLFPSLAVILCQIIMGFYLRQLVTS